MVSDGSRAGGVCRTPGRECLFWPCHPTTPTTYYIVLVSRIRGAGYIQYGYSKNTRTTREACEASANSVLLLLIGLIR